MDSSIRQHLQEMIRRYGTSLCGEPKRCKAILNDLCPNAKKEIRLLISALEEDIGNSLLNPPNGIPMEMLLQQLIKRLHEELSLQPEAAHWTVETWALALGVIKQPLSNQIIAANSVQKNPSISIFTPKSGDTFQDKLKDGSLAPEMVIVPAGEFMMGSKDDNNEKPIHDVTITKPFALGKYQVTFEDYDKYCKATETSKPSDSGWGRRKRPVINVSWNDVQKYCQWLSQQTGEEYRLPTEAEWEYACRAGTTTRYWWGDEIGKNKANCDGCGSRWGNQQTAPVGSFKPNPFGLYDMYGNVWEWCQDGWHGDYKGAPTDGSAWEGGDGMRVLRGGSWSNLPGNLRSALRSRNSPDYLFYNLGFRVVRSSPSIL